MAPKCVNSDARHQRAIRNWTDGHMGVGVGLAKADGRPATGTDAAATIQISVAIDNSGGGKPKLSPGQDEGSRPLVLEGTEGGYQATQAAVTGHHGRLCPQCYQCAVDISHWRLGQRWGSKT